MRHVLAVAFVLAAVALGACSIPTLSPTGPAAGTTPASTSPPPTGSGGTMGTPTSTSAAGGQRTPSPYDTAERRTHQEVNDYRRSQGLTVMAYDTAIAAVARAHSLDMAERGFFDHVNPDGLDPQDRVDAAGLHDLACGENLFKVTDAMQEDAEYIAAAAFTGWSNSPSHHENMVARGHNVGGVGVVVRPKRLENDRVPQRYDIYVTHLLCRDVWEVNRLKAEYEAAKALHDHLAAEFRRLEAEYLRAAEQYEQGEVSFEAVEEARRRYVEAARQLNTQVAIVNDLVARLEAAAQQGQ